MKKALLAIAAVLGLSLNASAQKAGEDNGFGLRLNVGFGGGTVTAITEDEDFDFSGSFDVDGVSFGLTLDNRWYVWHNDKMGAAIQARWFDANYLSGELNYDLGPFDMFDLGGPSIDYKQIDGGVLGVGPMFTWYLNNDMAIDAYYNIMPTVAYAQVTTEEDVVNAWGMPTGETEETESNYWGAGISHHIGAAFRYKVFQAGLEFRFGKIKDMEEFDLDTESMDCSLNRFKINLGFKF